RRTGIADRSSGPVGSAAGKPGRRALRPAALPRSRQLIPEMRRKGSAFTFHDTKEEEMRRIALSVLYALLGWTALGSALAQETTPAMLAAAVKEGKVVWYT